LDLDAAKSSVLRMAAYSAVQPARTGRLPILQPKSHCHLVKQRES